VELVDALTAELGDDAVLTEPDDRTAYGRDRCRGPWPTLAGIPLLRTTASSDAAAVAGSLSAAISAMLTIPSVATIRSRICQSGPRTLHLLYCSQSCLSVEQAVTVKGPSIA
jgi:hypothetical protein